MRLEYLRSMVVPCMIGVQISKGRAQRKTGQCRGGDNLRALSKDDSNDSELTSKRRPRRTFLEPVEIRLCFRCVFMVFSLQKNEDMMRSIRQCVNETQRPNPGRQRW